MQLMSEVIEVEVLVVGAGPVGLTMASELLRYGIPCRIIDKNASSAHESRALGLQARTLEVFADMGVIDEVLTQSKPVHSMNAYANQHRIAHIDFKFDALDTPYPFLRVLPQNDSEQILNKHLIKQGLQVERQTAITALNQNQSGITVTLVDGQGQTQTLRTRWLVGCDGAHSTVRHLLNLSFAGSDYEQQFLLADLHIDWNFPADELHIFLTPDGAIITFPLPTPGIWRVVYTNGEGQSEDPTHVIKLFQELLNAHGAPEAVLSNPTWISAFRFHRRMVSQFRSGRCECGRRCCPHSQPSDWSRIEHRYPRCL